jgi:hypothetical protein
MTNTRLTVPCLVAVLLFHFGAACANEAEAAPPPSSCLYERELPCAISLAALLADPQRWLGRNISVVGFLDVRQGVVRLYLHEDSMLVGDIASSILVRQDDESTTAKRGQSGNYVRVFGVVEYQPGRTLASGIGIAPERVYTLMSPDGRDTHRKLDAEERDR